MRNKRLLAGLLCVLLVFSIMPVEVLASGIDRAGRLCFASASHVNPLYPDAAAPECPESPDALAWSTGTIPRCSTVAEAAAVLREAMENRVETVQFTYAKCESKDKIDPLFREIIAATMVHTGVPTQGDYLQWQYGGIGMSCSFYSNSDGSVRDIQFTFTVSYYTTAKQETEMDAAVEKLLGELNLFQKTDYEKICGIYDYICDHVVYDYANLNNSAYKLKNTAYAALINGTSVCQGYSNLFYRLALELGLDCRVITGDAGGPHAWNIVVLEDKYYYLDATWDAPRFDYGYDYFLRGSSNFLLDHTPDEEFKTTAFLAKYPIDAEDYPIPAPRNGTCGENLTWVLADDGTLTISGDGAMDDYNDAAETPWFAYCGEITALVIESGAASIGNYAFSGCSALAKVAIPDSVTRIGRQAFADCVKLTKVQISANVTNIGEHTFSGCSKLAEITVDNANLYYSSLNGVLFNKNQTTLIAYPAGRTQTDYTIADGVSTIGENAFEGCGKLVNLTVPASVTYVGTSAFCGCTRLATVYYYGTDWDAVAINGDNEPLLKAKVVLCGTCGEELTWMLTEDGQLTISGTGEMDAFSEDTAPWSGSCEKITKVVVASGVTGIGANAFAGCVNLERVTLRAGLICIAENAFSGCTALTVVRFCGDEEQWAGVEIGAGNDCLTGAQIEIVGGQLGDVNDDEKINGTDTNLVFRYVSGTAQFADAQIKKADVNGDGKVNGTDTNILFRFVSGVISSMG